MSKLLSLAFVFFSPSIAYRHHRSAPHPSHSLGLKTGGSFTDHFAKFLKKNKDEYEYILNSYTNYGITGTFGGRDNHKQETEHIPILFIHGNSDSALDFGNDYNSGWNRHLSYFSGHGYTSSEMYGLTYGDRILNHSFMRSINCDDIMGHRKFAEAILKYTGHHKLNIIAHSMGVTIARAVIQGGEYNLHGKVCNLGESLTDRIETFIAIASANYGMCLCEGLSQYPACNNTVGYYPGTCQKTNILCNSEVSCDAFGQGYSTILEQLNSNGKDANFVASLWSSGDQVIGVGKNWAYGKQTSLVPHSDVNVHFADLSHFAVKTDTVRQQYHLLKHHDLPSNMYNPIPSSDNDL